MSSLPVSKCLVLAAAMLSAPALADVEFTSQPPTSASVGRAYSYRMTAAIVGERDDEDGQCLIWSPNIPPGQQPPPGDCAANGVPPGQRPRAGQCRIWYPGVPPGQQPPPFACDDYDDAGDITFVARALPRWLEFDGEDTIFGTPRPEDVGEHRVRLRARADDDQADQEFSINVAAAPSPPPAEGADLAAAITVTPAAAAVGDSISWRATARNLAGVNVANFQLETALFGDASFRIDAADDSSCSIEPRGSLTAVVCRWSSLASGASRSVVVRGAATGAGDILAVASVSIVDAVPTDRNSANDSATAVLRVSAGSAADGFPALTLNGLAVVTVMVGDPYTDAGATAMDDRDGDLTSRIVVDNPVDTRIVGRYTVTYDVADSAGNASRLTRAVEVAPREGVGGGGGGAVGAAFLLLISFGAAARWLRVLRVCIRLDTDKV